MERRAKDYSSWDAALKDAEAIGLISSVEAIAAKALPPGFPLHTCADVEPANLEGKNFTIGKHLRRSRAGLHELIRAVIACR